MGKLDPVYISNSDLDERSSQEAGWYIVDSHHHLIDGPFPSRESCAKAIRGASGTQTVTAST